MVKINVNTAKAVCVESPHPLTSGMVGLSAEFQYSADWDGLIKNAVVRGSNETRVVLGVDGAFTVPWECLTTSGSRLEIGVEGRAGDGSVVIPTVYAYIGRIYPGVDDNAEETVPPTPTQAEQLQSAIAAVAEAGERLTESVASIDNDVEQTVAALAAEIAARKAADAETNAAVTAERDRAKAAEEENADAIANEASRAKAAEADLQRQIDAGGGGGGGAVSSVNGKTGAVQLTAEDVGGQPAGDYAAAQHRHDASDIDNLTSGVSAVSLAGTELTPDENGKVDVPVAAMGKAGVVKVNYTKGIQAEPNGDLYCHNEKSWVDGRVIFGSSTYNSKPAITNALIDYAICASLTDGKSASLWTADKQAAARALLGISIWDGGASE